MSTLWSTRIKFLSNLKTVSLRQLIWTHSHASYARKYSRSLSNVITVTWHSVGLVLRRRHSAKKNVQTPTANMIMNSIVSTHEPSNYSSRCISNVRRLAHLIFTMKPLDTPNAWPPTWSADSAKLKASKQKDIQTDLHWFIIQENVRNCQLTAESARPVSYTHLTLPTILRV